MNLMKTINYDTYDWHDCTFSKAYCESIYKFIKGYEFKDVKQSFEGLEIGFNSGSSALVFLTAFKNAKLISVDHVVWPEAEKLLEKHSVRDRMTIVTEDSHTAMTRMIQSGLKFDYIYVDGDHIYDGVKKDLYDAAELLTPHGVILVDDCVPNHGHFGVFQAVTEFLADHPNFNKVDIANNPNLACALVPK